MIFYDFKKNKKIFLKNIKNIFILLFFLFYFLLININYVFSFNNNEKIIDYLNAGIEEYRKQNYEEAMYYLLLHRQKINNNVKDPQHGITNYYLGLIFKQTNDYDKSIYCFEQSLKGDVPVLDSYPEIINLYYDLGNLEEALKFVNEAENKKIFPSKISFLKGQIYLKINKNKLAIQSFQKAKKEDKTLAGISDLQIAITNINDMRYNEAIEQFNKIINNKQLDNEEIKQIAINYKNVYKKMIDEYSSFKVNFGTGVIFDSNVTAKPITDIQYLPSSRSKDMAIMGFLNFNYAPLNEKRELLFNAQYTINGTFYKRLNNFNSINQNFIGSINYSDDNYILNFPVILGYNTLGGNGYMFNIGIKPNITYILTENNKQFVNIGINMNKRNMLQEVYDIDENRNAMLYGFNIGYTLIFGEANNNFLNFKYDYIIDKSKGYNWVNNNQKIGIYYMNNIKNKIDIITGIDISPQNYKNVNTIFDIKRKDIIYNINLISIYKIINNFYLNSQYMYTRVISNISLYNYKKNMLTFGLEVKF